MLLSLSIFLPGCEEEKVDDLQSIIISNRLMEFQGPQQQAFQCHDVDAVIPVGGKVEGPNCTDNKTVLNGHSDKCVQNGQCNAQARVREFNAEAKQFCVDWCAAKKCDFSYTNRGQCDFGNCVNSNSCVQNCQVPLLDYCSIIQAAPNYNCECKDPPPPPQEGPVES